MYGAYRKLYDRERDAELFLDGILGRNDCGVIEHKYSECAMAYIGITIVECKLQ